MGFMTQFFTEEIVRRGAQYAGIAIIALSVFSMLSWCLAAGIMPRVMRRIPNSKTDNRKGARRQ